MGTGQKQNIIEIITRAIDSERANEKDSNVDLKREIEKRRERGGKREKESKRNDYFLKFLYESQTQAVCFYLWN